ncbi:MAG TPA: hypothetical protein VFO79_06975 [Xanthomonadales bacterium]|nr:hypothetical protein [Xanthomonadales bacterium]
MRGRTPYLCWLVASAAILAAARAADPYLFGLAAFAAAAISAVLFAASCFFGLRPALWAAVAAIPTVVSFVVLSTYRWA